MTQLSPTLTPKQAAERLNAAGVPCSGETVRRWVKSGRLTGAIVLPSGRIRIPVAVIDGITKGTPNGQLGLPVDQAEGHAAAQASAGAEAPQDEAAAQGQLTNPSRHHQ